ncbi:MAG: Glu-tRNA(Gln) amidotransferase subunit GatE [Candidatus Hodarchaeales archaeon]|jgi:glutamyl-tRNA(Gln) amidotransferase subunit E
MLDPEKIDYKEIGFRAGLEVHHQIKTSTKLFCRCKPELIQRKKPDYTFERYFRPVLGEMGDFDPGMLVEFEKGYQVIYHGWDTGICTYEMDETPPFYPAEDAIDTGYKLSFLFNCSAIVEELVVNRKQYLDGSITTGFQRTMIIGRDGYILINDNDGKKKKVRITNVLIEEDAARKIKTENNGRTVYYNLDRLGIPLTEVITDYRDVENPTKLIETAKTIGNVIRLSSLGMRGIGSVRQDVNISITGGRRVELKGVQNLNMLEKYCSRECTRQHALLKIKDMLIEQGDPDLEHAYIDMTDLFPAEKWTTNTVNEGIYALKLPKFGGILKREVQPGKDLGMEMFEKAELITGIPRWQMFHSGEISPECIRKKLNQQYPPITKNLHKKIIKALQIDEKRDSYIIVYGPRRRAMHALKKIVERAKLTYEGVPQETRHVLPNGNNEFLRVIHGKDRLYPDTDTPSMPVQDSRIDTTRKSVSSMIRPWQLEKKMLAWGFTKDQVELLIRHDKIDWFLNLVQARGFPAKLVYNCLVENAIYLRRKGHDLSNLVRVNVEHVLQAVTSKQVPMNRLTGLLEFLLVNRDLPVHKAIKHFQVDEEASRDLDDKILKEIRKLRGMGLKRKRFFAKVVGNVLYKNDYQLDGSLVNDRIEKLLAKDG